MHHAENLLKLGHEVIKRPRVLVICFIRAKDFI